MEIIHFAGQAYQERASTGGKKNTNLDFELKDWRQETTNLRFKYEIDEGKNQF